VRKKMNITILNGSPKQGALDAYLDKLIRALEKGGHTVAHLVLREMKLHPCTGCFNCWVKTPGHCIHTDDSDILDQAIIRSDFLLWASPLQMGFPSAIFKTAMDKHIPLLHPYLEISNHEMHHVRRYEHYPRLGMLVEPEADTDEDDMHILTNIFARAALNFKSRLEFFTAIDLPVEQLVNLIAEAQHTTPLFTDAPAPAEYTRIAPPRHLTIFNGSPRGNASNSMFLMNEFIKGFDAEYDLHHLYQRHALQEQVQAFGEAECVWLALPLYTDGMPGIVTQFIEALAPLKGRPNNPAMGFLVQSAFNQGAHSRYIERYCQKLAARLGSPYLGTIVKCGSGALHVLPTSTLFKRLQSLGNDLSQQGYLNPRTVHKIASPERYTFDPNSLIQNAMYITISRSMFDQQLKKNGAYAKRFDQPFLTEN